MDEFNKIKKLVIILLFSMYFQCKLAASLFCWYAFVQLSVAGNVMNIFICINRQSSQLKNTAAGDDMKNFALSNFTCEHVFISSSLMLM
jgi:hypothetical protein